MALRMGITKTGWRSFRRQQVFTVHFLRRNTLYAVCRVQVPYKENFEVLPRNAVLCERCRTARTPGAS